MEAFRDPSSNLFSDMLRDDFYDLALDLVMSIAFLIPSFMILSKYREYMDQFTRWMIMVYNIGFLCKLSLNS